MQRFEFGKKSVGQIVLKDTWTSIVRRIHKNTRVSYYDSLGITPKASQADIKKAFYKLSMEFHPDKQTGNEAKFKEISSAYEVLGNLKLRRMYDRGLLPSGVTNPSSVNDDYREEYHTPKRPQYPNNSEQFERRKPPPSGRSDRYDFDAWTRAHYSEHFRPDSRRNQWINMQYARANRIREQQKAMEKVVLFFACFVFSLAFFTNSTINNWDRPTRRKPEPDDV